MITLLCNSVNKLHVPVYPDSIVVQKWADTNITDSNWKILW